MGLLKNMVCLSLAPSSYTLAQGTEKDYITRKNYGAKYEPIGNKILHGAGQDATAFANYIQSIRKMPAVSIQYVSPHHNYQSLYSAKTL